MSINLSFLFRTAPRGPRHRCQAPTHVVYSRSTTIKNQIYGQDYPYLSKFWLAVAQFFLRPAGERASPERHLLLLLPPPPYHGEARRPGLLACCVCPGSTGRLTGLLGPCRAPEQASGWLFISAHVVWIARRSRRDSFFFISKISFSRRRVALLKPLTGSFRFQSMYL